MFWKPKGSKLREEVKDLWARRNKPYVCETLKPFLNDTIKASTSSSEKLLFHMAVMRWKCSLLTPDEVTVLHDWIDEQQRLKEKTQALPWSEEAGKHGDDVFAENIQRYVVLGFCRQCILTLSSAVPLTTLHPQYRRLSKKLNGKWGGR